MNNFDLSTPNSFLDIIFTIGFNTPSGIYHIPDSVTIREVLIAPELDRDFANRILTKYQDIYPKTDFSELQKITSLNSSELWEDIAKKLADLEKYHPRLYALFSRHKFRHEFVGEQLVDIESIASFVAWNNLAIKRIFQPYETSGRKYDVNNGIIYISCTSDFYYLMSLYYCSLMLPVELKYSPSDTTIYKTRHKLFSALDKYHKPLEENNLFIKPIQSKGEVDEAFKDRHNEFTKKKNKNDRLEGETDKAFKNRQDKFRKKENEKNQVFKTNQETHNLLSRFTAYDKAQNYLQDRRDEHEEAIAVPLKRYLIDYVKELDDTKRERQAEQYKRSKNSQLNTEIIDPPNETESILSQCQFCYRYKIIEREKIVKKKTIFKRKKDIAWHCNREECKNAYRAWVNDLYSKHIKLEDLR